jgi:hypothetical protein
MPGRALRLTFNLETHFNRVQLEIHSCPKWHYDLNCSSISPDRAMSVYSNHPHARQGITTQKNALRYFGQSMLSESFSCSTGHYRCSISKHCSMRFIYLGITLMPGRALQLVILHQTFQLTLCYWNHSHVRKGITASDRPRRSHASHL